ncbi:MAG TPA: c-type cytochrome [Oscillatoriales cyanobacterium M59_W2019_021]|nr:c-type cytochrome [Oscillatoriales cyanobacterium M4454_W2019_049]HIK52374.1 c-type cytochrome [Oscillatoriales cyanobacterium M59_W2019_021]
MANSVISLEFPRWGRSIALLAIAALLGIALSILLHHSWKDSPSGLLAGGATTVHNRSSRAFSQPSPGLSAEEFDRHGEGDANFDAVFVTAPALVNPGLGPLFNNASCTGCHIKDGRGMPQMGQSLVRVSLPQPTIDPHIGAVPVPGIGVQVRDQAIYGHVPDAKVTVEWQERSGQYPDGTPYKLRSPQVLLGQLDPKKPIPANTLTSLRVPPPVFGTGLLEAIPDKAILALADPDDKNKDGISGQPNFVWDPQQKTTVLGRFGLKANTSSLHVQTAAAYVNDMGVTNPIFPEANGSSDIDAQVLDTTTFYVQTLGVPERTMLDDPQVQRGEKLFTQANCATCHTPMLKTGKSDIKVLANQTIHPYTDMLLHDMGLGLADGRPDFEATGSEWRTAPLWGVGLTQTVLPYSGYLHDGRARTLEEAILWHGGEAEASKTEFMTMKNDDRSALLKFLNSL